MMNFVKIRKSNGNYVYAQSENDSLKLGMSVIYQTAAGTMNEGNIVKLTPFSDDRWAYLNDKMKVSVVGIGFGDVIEVSDEDADTTEDAQSFDTDIQDDSDNSATDDDDLNLNNPDDAEDTKDTEDADDAEDVENTEDAENSEDSTEDESEWNDPDDFDDPEGNIETPHIDDDDEIIQPSFTGVSDSIHGVSLLGEPNPRKRVYYATYDVNGKHRKRFVVTEGVYDTGKTFAVKTPDGRTIDAYFIKEMNIDELPEWYDEAKSFKALPVTNEEICGVLFHDGKKETCCLVYGAEEIKDWIGNVNGTAYLTPTIKMFNGVNNIYDVRHPYVVVDRTHMDSNGRFKPITMITGDTFVCGFRNGAPCSLTEKETALVLATVKASED